MVFYKYLWWWPQVYNEFKGYEKKWIKKKQQQQQQLQNV